MTHYFSEEHPLYPIRITTNVILTTFLAVISAVSTMIADSTIQGDLGLSNTDTIWITTLYMLGVNTTVPTGNWFANQFGFNRMYACGVFIFTGASILAGLSTDFPLLAIARFLEGVGAGFIFPIGLGLIVQNMPKERVNLAITLYVGLAFGLGLTVGVPFAGYLSQFASWRYIFFSIAGASALAGAFCWITHKKKSEIHKTQFDVFGFMTFALFVASLLIALTMGPIRSTDEGWRTPYIIFLFLLAFASLVTCILVERRHPNPLLPLPLFKNPLFAVCLAAMFLLGMATFASVAVSVTYMLNGLAYERWVTSQIAAVYGIVFGIVSMLSNYLTKKLPIPILTFVGLGLLSFSYFYNNELSWLTGYRQVVAILIIRGIGIGLSLGPTTILALSDVSEELKTAASTILTFFRQVGGTYGTTLLSIFSIRQTIFHTARFSEQTNTQLPGYQMTFQNLYDKFPDVAAAKATIIKNLLTQAHIQGLNDALMVFGYITSAVTCVLIVLIGIRSWKARQKVPS